MTNIVIKGPRVYTEQAVLNNAALQIVDNKIHAIGSVENTANSQQIEFPPQYHLLPGLIDLHIHGANGKDIMDGDHEAFATICAALAREGVTGFLPTTMTAESSKLSDVLASLRAFSQKQSLGARMLGVHLEGPFLSPEKVGAQGADHLLQPNVAFIKKWQEASGNFIKLMTIAPELENSLACIRYLREQNIVASIGHTHATYDQAVAAIDAGCTHVTHLFNAMRGLHHREPGVIAAALLAEHVSTELIADGVHLHPAVIELVLKLKKNAVLVTDAMRAQCMSDGAYELGGQSVVVKQSVARLADGTLAGSTLTLSNALRNVLQFTRCELQDAIRLVAENPAKILNIFSHKGSLAVGKDADLIVLNEKYEVMMTMVEGEVVFEG